MTVETATNVNELNPNYPADTDDPSEGAAHIRQIKDVMQGARGIPPTAKSAAYTFVLTDANNGFRHPAADTTARTWTIPSNASVAFDVGTCLVMLNEKNAGDITIAITTDTMVAIGTGQTGSRTLADSGLAFAWKVDTNLWYITGTNLT